MTQMRNPSSSRLRSARSGTSSSGSSSVCDSIRNANAASACRLCLLTILSLVIAILYLSSSSSDGPQSPNLDSAASAQQHHDLRGAVKRGTTKVRHLLHLDREYSGYGPAHPRVAVVVHCPPTDFTLPTAATIATRQVVGAVKSIFGNTDRNRILVVVVVLDGLDDEDGEGGGGAQDDDAARSTLNGIRDQLASIDGGGGGGGHWHGNDFHRHGDDADADGADGREGQHSHGQKVYVMANPSAPQQGGVSTSRSDAVDFVNILIGKHERAKLKRPDEDILLLLLRHDARLVNGDWLPIVTDALVVPPGPDGEAGGRKSAAPANAVSLHVDSPQSKPGDVITIDSTLTPKHGTASHRDLAGAKHGGGEGSEHIGSYPTPMVSGVATAMRLSTYANLPAADLVLEGEVAANVELSLNLWLCGDGVDVLPGARVTVKHTSELVRGGGGGGGKAAKVGLDDADFESGWMKGGLTDEEAARIAAAWLDGDGQRAVFEARVAEKKKTVGGTSSTRAMKRMAVDAFGSPTFPIDLGKRCRPFEYLAEKFGIDLLGPKSEGLPALDADADAAAAGVASGDNAGKHKDVHQAAAAAIAASDLANKNKNKNKERKLPSQPLDPRRLAQIESTPQVKLEYVPIAHGKDADHPHRGARDKDGKWDYKHDETALKEHAASIDFEMPDKDAACAKRDSNYKMLTEKVYVDRIGDEAAERAHHKRPKILCVMFTIEKYHDKLHSIRDTWGRKCDGVVFGSDKSDPELGAVEIPHEGIEEYDNIWQKVRSIWGYVYDNYYEDYDYFHSCGDDVYLLIENMKLYFESEEIQVASNGGTYLPTDDEEYQTPLFLGRRFAEGGDRKLLFNSGGSGYTLNKAALKTLVVDSFPTCMPHLHTFSEDVLVARCLRKMGVVPYDTKDEAGGERYNPFQPGHHLTYRPPADPTKDWYSNYSIDCKWGIDHCAARSVAFHYIKPALMYRIHAILYGHCDAR